MCDVCTNGSLRAPLLISNYRKIAVQHISVSNNNNNENPHSDFFSSMFTFFGGNDCRPSHLSPSRLFSAPIPGRCNQWRSKKLIILLKYGDHVNDSPLIRYAFVNEIEMENYLLKEPLCVRDSRVMSKLAASSCRSHFTRM